MPVEGIQIDRQRGDQGFALTGAHLGDFALVQHDPADHLNIIMAQTDGALAGFSHGCEGFRQQVVQRLTFCQARAEFAGFLPQRLIAQRFEGCFQAVDLLNDLGIFIDLSFIGVAPNMRTNFFNIQFFLVRAIIA